MKPATCLLFLLILLLAPGLRAGDGAKADTLRTGSGEFLRGKFLKLEGGKVHFQTTDLGTVQVPVERIEELALGAARKVRIRLGIDVRGQEEVTLSTRQGLLVVRGESGEREIRLSEVKGIDETVPAGEATWSVSGRAFVSYTDGNTKNFALGYRFDVRRNTPLNEIKLFAEGNILQDRKLEEDQVRRRDYGMGLFYRYLAPFRMTCDLSQDLFINEFAGFHYRSVTATGLSYFPVREADASWSLSAAATYTVEDLIRKAEDREFFGARAGTEIDVWAEKRALHLRLKAEVNFDFEELKNVTALYEALLGIRAFEIFTLGISFRDVYDNLPPPKRFHHDVTISAVLGISWGGKGP